MNKKIIIALIIIVLIALVGIFAFANAKENTQINFLSNTTLQNGQEVIFELKDSNGNALADQQLDIVFGANGQNQTYSIITDSEGKGGLLLNDEALGEHNVTVKYAGDNDHNGCEANQTINISEGYYEESYDTSSDYTDYSSDSSSSSSSDYSSSSSSSDSSSQSSNIKHDSELNVDYDSNGKIVGGQNDGADYEDVKNQPQPSDDDFN